MLGAQCSNKTLQNIAWPVSITRQGEYVFKYSRYVWVGTTGIIGMYLPTTCFKYSGDVWVGTTGIIGDVPTYFRCKYLQCLALI